MDGESIKLHKINCIIINLIICIPFAFYWLRIHEFFSSPLSIAIISILLTFMFLLNFRKIVDRPTLIMLMCSVGMLALNGFLYNGWGCVFTCYNITILSAIFYNIQFSKSQLKRFHLLIVVLLFIFLLSLEVKPHYKTYTVTGIDDFKLNLNGFGLLILACFFHFFLCICKMDINDIIKALLYIVSVLCVTYFVIISGSRTAIITLGVFFVLLLFKNWKMKNYKTILWCFIVFAIILPFLYLGYIELYESVEFAGKALNTRELVWKSTWILIKHFPIMGSGTIFGMTSSSGGTLTDSAHNVFWGLWKTVGVVPLIVFVYCICKGKNIGKVTKVNKIEKKMFLACIVISAFETVFNDSNLYIFFISLLLTQKEAEEEVK